jgi:hypothetical protein
MVYLEQKENIRIFIPENIKKNFFVLSNINFIKKKFNNSNNPYQFEVNINKKSKN